MVKFKLSESCIENSMDNALQFISQYQCCPLCPPSLLIKQSFQKHFISTHFHRAVDINVSGKAVSCLPCYKNCTNTDKRSHFHCCMCPAVITRRFNFKRHLELCSTAGKRLFSGDDKVPDDATSTKLLKNQNWERTEKSDLSCRFCHMKFQHLSSLRRHAEKAHSVIQSKYSSILVDRKSGIFVVACSSSGLLAPIHVQKCIFQKLIMCSNSVCCDIMKASSVFNPAIECEHLKSVENAQIQDDVFLDKKFLNKLVQLKIISENSKERCSNLHDESIKNDLPLISYADFQSLGYSGRMKYYSVYTHETKYFCKLRRVRVTYDSNEGVWSCECPVSKQTVSCVHESISKWYMCQYQPELFSCALKSCTDTSLTNDDKFIMEYYITKKSIPWILSDQLLDKKKPSKPLISAEVDCPSCMGSLQPLPAKKGTVYGMGVIWHDIWLVGKQCQACGLKLRFQQYETGVHNFNNTVLLTLKLCDYLKRGVKNHVATERCLKLLFNDSESLPLSVIRNGFYHFLAMQDTEYKFVCNRCGCSPKIVVGDGNWKNTCLRPVHSVRGLSSHSQLDDLVDVDSIWKSYKKEIIGRGFFGARNNPWHVSITYKTVAPWIGKESRINAKVPNTEFKKGASLENINPETIKQNNDMSHEDLLNAMYEPNKNSSQHLKVLCGTFGIKSSENIDEMVNQLVELVIFKDLFPKHYKSIQRCGGGIVHMRCIHGVCVYMKCLLRQESARDYVDGLQSFYEQPKVVISDVASQIALHGERRRKGMFYPYKGMLYEWNETNLSLEREGMLPSVSIDFDQTGSFYSLNDAFHAKSKKKGPARSFRDLHNTDLIVNSSVCEQKNNNMAKDRYSFCGMDMVNFMFISRLSIHLDNEEINANYIKKIKTSFPDIYYDQHGSVIPLMTDRKIISDPDLSSKSANHSSIALHLINPSSGVPVITAMTTTLTTTGSLSSQVQTLQWSQDPVFTSTIENQHVSSQVQALQRSQDPVFTSTIDNQHVSSQVQALQWSQDPVFTSTIDNQHVSSQVQPLQWSQDPVFTSTIENQHVSSQVQALQWSQDPVFTSTIENQHVSSQVQPLQWSQDPVFTSTIENQHVSSQVQALQWSQDPVFTSTIENQHVSSQVQTLQWSQDPVFTSTIENQHVSSQVQKEYVSSKKSLESEKLTPSKFCDIKHLWESKHSGRVEVVIGNMAIKTDSMKRLQSAWLDDDVMEGVLKALVLKAKKKIVVLSPVYSTMWFWNGRFRQSTSSKLANSMIDHSFITVVNVNGNHWLLMVKSNDTKSIYLYDSFGKEPIEYIPRIKKNFGSFFRHYQKTTPEWRYCCRKHNQQKDFMNCGPLALMEAERFLCQNLFEDADFKADSTSCNLYRENFGNLLLDMTDETRLENYCLMCHDAKPPKSFHGDTINWVSCEECRRWCHEICLKGCFLKTTFTCQHH
ncbi:unnamed protein product [Clavelina lepadiformis]|uniref:Ubiquitin-like protease family profile domain-containing protein n=1 Tax=Clavelina lepadiformis TaxID=159417 RepID=A0ABP0FJN4_CLALP